MGIALLLVVLIFRGVIAEELKYTFGPKPQANVVVQTSLTQNSAASQASTSVIYPADEQFSIIVPKIGANSRIIQDVNPASEPEYTAALYRGVAHAQGTALPNEPGNMFLFAHSTDTFFNANRYNSVFYLLRKLTIGDKFFIVHNSQVYNYEVTEIKTVEPTAVEYLNSASQFANERTATLMTCWPPGTTLNRLLVIGKQI